jgi:hypothetical protein
MPSAVVVEGKIICEPGLFYLHVERQIEVRVLAADPRRLANRFAHLELSTQMYAETPDLLIDDEGKASWRVPIHLTLPAFGDVGRVGYLHVDPLTGKIDTTSELLDDLTTNAEAVALRFAPDPAYTV